MNHLDVALYVYEPVTVDLTVRDHVRLGRMTRTADQGFVAQRHGDLLRPGMSTLELAAGVYYFRTTGDAKLRLAEEADVTVVTPSTHDRRRWPDQPRPGGGPGLGRPRGPGQGRDRAGRAPGADRHRAPRPLTARGTTRRGADQPRRLSRTTGRPGPGCASSGLRRSPAWSAALSIVDKYGAPSLVVTDR